MQEYWREDSCRMVNKKNVHSDFGNMYKIVLNRSIWHGGKSNYCYSNGPREHSLL